MRSPTGNEIVRALPVAVLGLVFLTGCVGSDPNAALRGAGTAGLTTRPMTPSVAAVATGLAPVGPMPGDLLIAPPRVVGGTDPLAVLARSEVTTSYPRIAHASPIVSPIQRAASTPVLGTALPARAAVNTTRTGAPPLLAAHLGPVSSPMAVGAVAEGMHPAEVMSGAISEIEARATAEQRLQAARDQRFDTAVRRATNLVCSNCTSGAAASANHRVRRAQAVAPDDEAE